MIYFNSSVYSLKQMEEQVSVEKYRIWPQLYSALTASLATACAGGMIGWTSPASSLLLRPDSGYDLDYNDISWIASILYLSAAIGPIFTILAVDKIGRKKTLLCSFLFYAPAWLIALFGSTFTHLMLFRLLGGIGCGISASCCPLYVAEVSEARKRGGLSVISPAFITMGILGASIIGPRFNITVLNGYSLAFPLLFAALFIWAPESPYFLKKNNKDEEALQSLLWLRGVKLEESVQKEMISISNFVKSNEVLGFVDTVKELSSRINLKAFSFVLVAFFGQQFSGTLAYVSYTEKIFRDVDSPLNPPDAVSLLASLTFCLILLSSLIVDRCGRRLTLLISCCGTFSCNILNGTYLLLSEWGVIDSSFSWMGVLGMFGFKISLAVGLSSVPYILMGEVFPSSTRSWSVCIVGIYEAFLSFTVTKMFQVLDSNYGGFAAFYSFAICVVVTFLFVYFFVPETKNLSFVEIQEKIQMKTIK